RLLERFVASRSGNYLLFFPSHDYLESVAEHFMKCSTTRVQRQESGMDLAARRDFIEAFRESRTPVTGFAVMGGLFGEGIDLVGQHLIGVGIVGVGLPQISWENDLIRERFSAEDDDGPQGQTGFDFAYTYPGINRVLQAAGRLIRSETDQG